MGNIWHFMWLHLYSESDPKCSSNLQRGGVMAVGGWRGLHHPRISLFCAGCRQRLCQ